MSLQCTLTSLANVANVSSLKIMQLSVVVCVQGEGVGLGHLWECAHKSISPHRDHPMPDNASLGDVLICFASFYQVLLSPRLERQRSSEFFSPLQPMHKAIGLNCIARYSMCIVDLAHLGSFQDYLCWSRRKKAEEFLSEAFLHRCRLSLWNGLCDEEQVLSWTLYSFA